MITGANGFLASHIVKDLLHSGHTVHACVRNAAKEESISHLTSLPGSEERLLLFSTGDLANAKASNAFDEAMKGCDAVFHCATPLNVKFGSHDGYNDIYLPAISSTQELVECIERNSDTVRYLVLTSSMSAVAPRPEPSIKDESHWSDADEQEKRGNWYGSTKTRQEQLVIEWINNSKDREILKSDFVFAAICPTMVIGPSLKLQNNPNDIGGTMGTLCRWFKDGKPEAPNDSMSFIHVEDCARMHTKILDLDVQASGRYMSLIESIHWNEILCLMRELYKNTPEFKPYEGSDKVSPTKFDLKRMNSLKVPVRSTREALVDSLDYLKEVGSLLD